VCSGETFIVGTVESSPDAVRGKPQSLGETRLSLTRQEHGVAQRVEIPSRTQDAQALLEFGVTVLRRRRPFPTNGSTCGLRATSF
jgi:hypothetical protein